MTKSDRSEGLSRRTFVRASVAAMAAPVASLSLPTAAVATGSGAYWLGRDWWGNRMQDWVRRGRRLECVAAPGKGRGRTVSALTWEVDQPSVLLRVRTGTLTRGAGFSGFVVGTGRAGDDWRARVLVGEASGTAGGFLATYEDDGTVRFREHTSERHQHRYAEIPSERRRHAGPRRRDEDVTLELTVRPEAGQAAEMLLRAFDTRRGTLLASARMQVFYPEHWVLGGVGLMSSDRKASGARYWFSHFAVEGAGALRLPERGLGPVVGTLFSVSESGLKMTAQLMPVDPAEVTSAALQIRDDAGAWRTAASAPVGPGFTAAFRVPRWNGTRAREYRVLVAGYRRHAYGGTIPAEPKGRELTIASISCVKAAHRRLDVPSRYVARLEEETPLGLYTSDNVWFPHDRLAAGIAAHQPDLFVAHGDQLYQNSPTGVDKDNLMLDFVGKYLLWLWSFREVTRSVPTVVLTDDHDIYQSNLWGSGGVAATRSIPTAGGYIHPADWVNEVQAMTSGHNPDPFDPTPVEQQIGVYFGSFVYGGVSFAVLEDRKFKPGPYTSTDETLLPLLGERQERFLETWATEHPEKPKVVLTQTSFACLQTDETTLASRDQDTNGWPGPGRDRALRLIRAAGALIVCGDQHIGMLTRHGIGRPDERGPDSGFDGPLQFMVPAGAASFQRWFEPGDLPNRGAEPHTGEWLDGFDNPVQVQAVVQPSVSRARFRQGYNRGWNLGDRRLKREGYGIVRVDAAHARMTLECWPWDVDPRLSDASQYRGFPVTVDCDSKLGVGTGSAS